MAFVIVSIYVYVLGLYGILNVKYVTVRLHNSSTGTTTYVSRLGDFYLHNKVVIDILYNYLLTISIPAISLVVVIVTTSVTIYKLRASMAWLRNGNAAVTSAERRETAVTSMLVILCCVYVICMTPSVTVAFVRNLIPDFLPTGRYCNAFKVSLTLLDWVFTRWLRRQVGPSVMLHIWLPVCFFLCSLGRLFVCSFVCFDGVSCFCEHVCLKQTQ